MGLSSEDAAHLLRRIGFGPTADDITSLVGLSIDAAVEQVLDTSSAPAAVAPAEAALDNTEAWWTRYSAIVQWWTDRMATTACPIQEKMALFWHGHFCSGLDKVDNFTAMFNQNQTFRNIGMGSFTALTQAVAIDPAMLFYLDNWLNIAVAPNENWARESMELFTLGINNYTQDDVVASARAWTGHGLDSTGTQYVFNPAAHDDGLKTFMGVTADFDGPDIINQILTGATQPIAAQFIAGKLWSFLAYPDPEPAVLDAITADFLASDNLDITALLQSILTQPEFWSDECRQGLIRTPTEFVAAAMRYSGIPAAQAHPEWYLGDMGQTLFEPPNVAGWGQNAYWVSSAAFWARAGFAQNMCWTLSTPTGPLADAAKEAPATTIEEAFELFGLTQPSASTRTAYTNWAGSIIAAEEGWDVQPGLITLALLSPDFQLNQ